MLDGNLLLELTVTWPVPMTFVDVLHINWTAPPKYSGDFMSDCHPEILGFVTDRKDRLSTLQSVTRGT